MTEPWAGSAALSAPSAHDRCPRSPAPNTRQPDRQVQAASLRVAESSGQRRTAGPASSRSRRHHLVLAQHAEVHVQVGVVVVRGDAEFVGGVVLAENVIRPARGGSSRGCRSWDGPAPDPRPSGSVAARGCRFVLLRLTYLGVTNTFALLRLLPAVTVTRTSRSSRCDTRSPCSTANSTVNGSNSNQRTAPCSPRSCTRCHGQHCTACGYWYARRPFCGGTAV